MAFLRRRTSSARHFLKTNCGWISERNTIVRCLGEPRQCWAIVEREARQRTVVFRPKDTSIGFEKMPDSRSQNAADGIYKPRNHDVFKSIGALEAMHKNTDRVIRVRRYAKRIRRTEIIWGIFERDANPFNTSSHPKDDGSIFVHGI